jgi:hypothetical protein
MAPLLAAIRLSKLCVLQRRYRLSQKKIFHCVQGRLHRARCNAEVEATLPASHLLDGPVRCSEAAAHHDICSSSCSLPRAARSCVGCLKPYPLEGFRGSRTHRLLYLAQMLKVAENGTRACHHSCCSLAAGGAGGGFEGTSIRVVSAVERAPDGRTAEGGQSGDGHDMQTTSPEVKSRSRKTRPAQAGTGRSNVCVGLVLSLAPGGGSSGNSTHPHQIPCSNKSFPPPHCWSSPSFPITNPPVPAPRSVVEL